MNNISNSFLDKIKGWLIDRAKKAIKAVEFGVPLRFIDPFDIFISCHVSPSSLITRDGKLIKTFLVESKAQTPKDSTFHTEILQSALQDLLKRAAFEMDLSVWVTAINSSNRTGMHSIQKSSFFDAFTKDLRKSLGMYSGHHLNFYISFVAHSFKKEGISDFIKWGSFGNRLLNNWLKRLNEADNKISAMGEKLVSLLPSDCFEITELSIDEEKTGNSEPIEFFLRLIGNYDHYTASCNDLFDAFSKAKIAFGFNSGQINHGINSKFFAVLVVKNRALYGVEELSDFYKLPIDFVVSEIMIPTMDNINDYLGELNEIKQIVRFGGDKTLDEYLELDKIPSDRALPKNQKTWVRCLTIITVFSDHKSELEANVASVYGTLSALGLVIYRADLKCEDFFWCRLPGNFYHIKNRSLQPDFISSLGRLFFVKGQKNYLEKYDKKFVPLSIHCPEKGMGVAVISLDGPIFVYGDQKEQDVFARFLILNASLKKFFFAVFGGEKDYSCAMAIGAKFVYCGSEKKYGKRAKKLGLLSIIREISAFNLERTKEMIHLFFADMCLVFEAAPSPAIEKTIADKVLNDIKNGLIKKESDLWDVVLERSHSVAGEFAKWVKANREIFDECDDGLLFNAHASSGIFFDLSAIDLSSSDIGIALGAKCSVAKFLIGAISIVRGTRPDDRISPLICDLECMVSSFYHEDVAADFKKLICDGLVPICKIGKAVLKGCPIEVAKLSGIVAEKSFIFPTKDPSNVYGPLSLKKRDLDLLKAMIVNDSKKLLYVLSVTESRVIDFNYERLFYAPILVGSDDTEQVDSLIDSLKTEVSDVWVDDFCTKYKIHN